MSKAKRICTLSALMFALAAGSSLAQQSARTKVGTLNCDISGGIGLIIASQKTVTCMFTPSAGGAREVYTGTITKFGLDIGATSGGEMVWAVYAPTSRSVGALAGSYTGASAEATVGAGLGANVLIGGSNRTVSLQPVSVQGQTGLNLAAGVAGLQLARAR
ncbi:MAG TPA: DUF992 domain-containing protein [Xanthobacteraceae bacterium]|nr:DUF992 domain-containing protein [Xanthobacteraceae bacterium]